MDVMQATQLLERYMQAANTQDFDTLDGMFADDVSVEWPQSGERYVGKDQCLNIFRNYPGGSPRYLGTSRVTGDGSVWVGEAEMMYPGEKKYLVVSIIEVRDGKIVKEIDYFTEPFPVPEWRKQGLTG